MLFKFFIVGIGALSAEAADMGMQMVDKNWLDRGVR